MEKVKLGDVFSVARGGSPRPIQNFITNKSDGVNWIMISDTTESKYIEGTKNKIKQEGVKNSRMVYPGDFLLTNSMSFGRPYILKIEGCIHDGWLVLSPRKQESASTDYFYHFLNSDQLKLELQKKAAGAVVKNLNSEIVRNLLIPLPSLSIQKEIAAKLDKADEIRRINQQLIAKYDELTQSLFFDMFGDPVKNEKGWEQVKLGDVCKVGSSRRVFVDELVENGIPFYRGTEIGALGNSEEIKPTLFITEEHYIHLKKETGVPSIGDLLMPSICPDGRIFEVKDNNPFYFKDGRVLWIKIDKEKVNSVYLKKFLKQLFATNYSKIASGTTFAELKIFALNDLTILFPSISLQNQFAERVQAIEVQKQLAQEALAKSEALFQSLLQESFKD